VALTDLLRNFFFAGSSLASSPFSADAISLPLIGVAAGKVKKFRGKFSFVM
jgi:hypothetical protein